MELNSFKIMNNKDLNLQKRKYHIFKHHTWAGLGFLAVLFALRFIFPLSTTILQPIIFILIIYILIALFLTYKYRSELSVQPDSLTTSIDSKKQKSNKKNEKYQFKIEKKRAKAEIKSKKKWK